MTETAPQLRSSAAPRNTLSDGRSARTPTAAVTAMTTSGREDIKWNATEASDADSMRVTETTGLSAEQPPWMAITPSCWVLHLTWSSGQDGLWMAELEDVARVSSCNCNRIWQLSYCRPLLPRCLTVRCAFVTELFVNWSNLCLFNGKLRMKAAQASGIVSDTAGKSLLVRGSD